jgi:replicative DNA helicase
MVEAPGGAVMTGTSLMAMPVNAAAEWSVLASMLRTPAVIGELVGAQLEAKDFSMPDTRLLYSTCVESYYAQRAVDPLVVGEACREELTRYWQLADPSSAAQELVDRVIRGLVPGEILEHVAIVKKLSTARQLMAVCTDALAAIQEGTQSPEEVGDVMSTAALQITSGHVKRSELLGWMDTGREYARHLQRIIAAREQGIEIGVYTSLKCIDDYTAGIGPGEVCFLAGEAGVGKSALAWTALMGFVAKQMKRPPELRVGTLVLSLEMGLYGSTQRVVQSLTGIDGVRLREGNVSKAEYHRVLTEWKNRENLPVVWNFASNFRLSQMRALIAEAIRRHHVGFVVLDHFRMVDTDRKYNNPLQEDEAKVRFISENIAKDLNVAVLVLAHSIKVGRGSSGDSPRPRLADLRGSGQIAAAADFVGFLYSPAKHMSDDAREEMGGDLTDMEVAWEKNRWGSMDSAKCKLLPGTMTFVDRY